MTKSVIITGVNGGIGASIAECFKSDGYRIIGIDRVEGSAICDDFLLIDLNRFVTDSNYRIENSGKILEKSSNLKALVNNAAIQILEHFTKLKPEQWMESINVNLSAAFFLSQVCFNPLRSNSGSIINIASIHANLTKKHFTAYASSKAALVGLTKALAVDAQGDIRVNAICPAAIETEMLKAGFAGKEDSFKLLKEYHPSQCIGTPQDVARLALFLVDDKNAFLNGSVITLDGGISSVLKDPE